LPAADALDAAVFAAAIAAHAAPSTSSKQQQGCCRDIALLPPACLACRHLKLPAI
jgi:hypothetical protein